MPNIAISGTYETVYISKPTDNKPVYVQVETVKEKYKTRLTFSFAQDVCPVTEVGQVFKMTADVDYQVYAKPKGEKDSHTFVVRKIREIQRYKQELIEIK